MRLAITTMLFTFSLQAATIADAKRVTQQLNAAIRAQDAAFISATYGPNAYRIKGNISWEAVREEAEGSHAVLANPVRTFSAEGIVTVFGWNGSTLYAAHFITRKGTLTGEGLFGIRSARTPAERDVIENFIRTLTEERLTRAFVNGDGSVITRIKRELGGLLQSQASAPTQSGDSLDALLRRYERVWFAHECAQLPSVYDPRATRKDVVSTFGYAGIQQFCAESARRQECSLKLVSQQQTAGGTTARIEIMCSMNASSASFRSKTLDVTVSNGAYRILREVEPP